MSIQLSASHGPGGWTVEANERRFAGLLKSRTVAFATWKEIGIPASVLSAAALRELEERPGASRATEYGGLFISDEAAAQLGEAEALGLGLPRAVAFPMDVSTTGVIGTESYRIQYHFVRGGVHLPAQRVGSAVSYGAELYRLPSPLFEIAEIADLSVEEKEFDNQVVLTSQLRALLPSEASDQLQVTKHLRAIRIAHANSFALDVSLKDGAVDFQPIPLGSSRDDQDHESEAVKLLTASQQKAFDGKFRQGDGTHPTYVLGTGSYVFVDKDLRVALGLVRRTQGASAEAKLAFLMSPARALREAMVAEDATSEDVERIERLFVETPEYSDRILSIGEWVPPQIVGLPREANNWLPERFSVALGGKIVSGTPEDVPNWAQAVSAALSTGAPTVTIGGTTVPVTEAVRQTLARLLPPEGPPATGAGKIIGEEKRTRRSLLALVTKENFEQGTYARQLAGRDVGEDFIPPMRSSLRPHQLDGLDWLKRAYRAGWPGVLLADDMGLGKTIQSLAFLQWLQSIRSLRRDRPGLIVAPTSLLANWEREHDQHLLEPGLGDRLIAYGSAIKGIRIGTGAEAEKGGSLLDVEQLRSAGWILTTYETLRDYQFSFSRVHFGCVVLDEVQKAKNPASRLTAALKSLRADFTLSMTGTPVENSLADLWTVADIVAPGMLPPLKEFMKFYGAPDEEGRRVLSKLLLEERTLEREGQVERVPPFVLRRMKSDIAADLPRKIPEQHTRNTLDIATMPSLQADRYAEVDSQVQVGQLPMLRALHDLRSISLHPIDPVAVTGQMSDVDYIMQSARVSRAFEILRTVRAANEKVLIFVHSKKIQNVLSVLIERQLAVTRPMIIRGDVPALQRQRIVDDFTKTSGFGALILSPKAAGVGLNIVAANHVIHLDRWWNPAVEDQCTDRAYRIGQTKPVHVYAIAAQHPLFGERSYDLILNDILERKRSLSKSIFMPLDVQPGDFAAAFSNAKGGKDDGSRTDGGSFNRMTPTAFEEWIRDEAIAVGLNARLTSSSWDGGADIVVKSPEGEVSHLIQSKFTLNPDVEIDNGMSSDLVRMRESWNAPEAKLYGITNARDFTSNVRLLAQRKGAELIARSSLSELRRLLLA